MLWALCCWKYVKPKCSRKRSDTGLYLGLVLLLRAPYVGPYSRISRKMYNKILPEKLGATYPHRKIKNFFPGAKIRNLQCTSNPNQYLQLFIVSRVSYGSTGQYANNKHRRLSCGWAAKRIIAHEALCRYLSAWIYALTPADERTSMDIWPPSVCPAAFPLPPPATTVPIVVQWPSWDGLLAHYALWRLITSPCVINK